MFKELLPPSIVGDEKIKAFAEAFEEQFDKLYALTDIPCIFPRIDELPEPVLDLLAWQFHIEGYKLAQTIEEKRNLIKNAIELHRYKGTKYAVKKVLEALKLTGEIKEWFEYEGDPYRFKVFVNSISEEELYKKLIDLINQYKNQRSWLDAVGLHNEIEDNVYVGSALNTGKTYTVSLHIDPKIDFIQLYYGSVLRTSKTSVVGVNQPTINTAPVETFVGITYRVACTITISAGGVN
ncbi:MAG: phage tail protein I [Thermodesulfobacterium sp.]|nr:phage tail protein I [Thermodesulfobacterium sp.]